MSDTSHSTLNVDTHADEANTDDTNNDVLTVGSYQLGKLLGQGAMGAVYEATHINLKRQVAIKILPSAFTALPDRLARFQREMEAVGRLDHPNIVRATDAGEADGVYFIAMELVDGLDVGQILEMKRAFNIASATAIARQVALGLDHIHQAGLVHRDIKPSNLLLDAKGRVKILDLGIAMLHCGKENSQLTSTGSLLGTPDFIAPEQVTGTKDVDIRADIYSLGCTLYMMLAGETPFHGPKYGTHTAKLIAHTTEPPIPLATVAKQVPKQLVAIIDRMMEKEPEDRYQTPAEVAEALLEWADESQLARNPGALHGSTQRTNPENWARRTAKKKRSFEINSKAIAIGAICAALGGFFAIQSLLFSDSGNANSALNDHLVDESVPTSMTDKNSLSNEPEYHPAHVSANRKQPENHDDSNSKRSNNVKQNFRSQQVESASQPDNLSNHSLTSNELELNAESIAEANLKLQESTAEIAATLKDLKDSFQSVAGKNGAIANPQSVGEFYHNARIYQRQGKHELARKAYFQVFEEDVDYVDVHEHFKQLLRLQEGFEGAREVYQQLVEPESAIGMLMLARLAPPSERNEALAEVIERYPDFAPAVYDRSVRVSQSVLNLRTLGEKQLERDLLNRFLELHKQGELVRHYLDPESAFQLLEEAQARLHSLKTENPNFDNPVLLSATPNNSGWNVYISTAEFANDLFYRLSPNEPFKSTGHMTGINTITGKPHPNGNISLPKNATETSIEIKYVDIRGETRGPYEVVFTPEKERLRFTKQVLESDRHGWIVFDDNHGRLLLYFTHLLSYKQAIKSIRYGLDGAPDREYPINRATDDLRDEMIYIEVPEATKFATVKLTYSNGEETEVVRFNRID